MSGIPISELLGSLQEEVNLSREDIADELGVTNVTVQNWMEGDSKPNPSNEGKLRTLYSEHLTRKKRRQAQLFNGAPELGDAVDKALRELREIYHRRGRFSSRNQVVEEVSKLLFSHVAPILADEGKGMDNSLLERESSPARSLRKYVDDSFNKYLDNYSSSNTTASRFEIDIEDQENKLSKELIVCISENVPYNLVRKNRYNDIINNVFGKFLADSFNSEKQLGQYLTPPEVVSFMVDLAFELMTQKERRSLAEGEMSDFGYVLDPSCGAASFLAEFIRQAHDRADLREEQQAEWNESVLDHVIGIDKSARMIRLAFTNMALFGHSRANVHLENSLEWDNDGISRSLRGQVGLILTNPPFGAEFSTSELENFRLWSEWTSSSASTIDSELLFLERYTEWLKPGGLFLAIVPDSVLMNVGIYEDLRDGLQDEISLEAVISLPKETFEAAGTQTKTSVVAARKRGEVNGSSTTTFAVCDDIGYTVTTRDSHKEKNYTGNSDLTKILDEIKGNSDNSKIRIIEDLESYKRWDARYHATLPKYIQDRINKQTDSDIYLKDVCDIVDRRENPKSRSENEFGYIQISNIEDTGFTSHSFKQTSDPPSRARKRVKEGDVLISTVRPENKNVCVVRPFQDNFICTTGLAVLRPRDVNGLFLAKLLKTDFVTRQLLRNSGGVSYPSFKEDCLADILLPIETKDTQEFDILSKDILEMDKRLREYHSELDRKIYSEVENWAESL